ncbi:Nse1 non-SMC component of SMC5-6 complex-domain-containing protein [Thelonectria olida]|uniref:Non-structural maintenance of chromosomes element 1 homolog n=1 Tax=Thelonectria olida TaxID=1576542 RepID=A0A9P9ATJ8_9HYPO|nr:Nse1 non-SMC component of SMC5-6 complex-domain-containing protein [Thelonectria olida]
MAQPQFTDANRAFLQAIMARGTITFEESRPILSAIYNADQAEKDCRPEMIGETEFQNFIDVASAASSMFDFEIRSTVHQVTKQRIYALVNTTSDPQTQLATTYSPDELSFINRVLDTMFDKHNSPRQEVLAITEMQAIKVARPDRRQSTQVDPDTSSTQTPADKGLKHSEVETVLAGLVEAGWFERSRGSYYTLSPRALLELRPWLIETYNDPDAAVDEWQRIKFCEACKDIVTIGLRCREPECTFRIHDICEDAFWRTRKDKKCPKCSNEWTGDKYVGERAVRGSGGQRGGQSRGGASRRSTANEAIPEDSEEEDAEGSDENLYDA